MSRIAVKAPIELTITDGDRSITVTIETNDLKPPERGDMIHVGMTLMQLYADAIPQDEPTDESDIDSDAEEEETE